MKTDMHTLQPAALEKAIALLDDEWMTEDPVLAPVIPVVLSRGVGQDWHKAGTFKHHLVGVARTLTLWDQPHASRLLGLLHSVYGNAQVDIVKFDPNSERGRVQALVGEDAERLIHLYCVIARIDLVRALLNNDIQADGSLTLPTPHGSVTLTARDVAIFTVVTIADICEQWYSWQDDIYSGYPDYDLRSGQIHWAAGLWPGPMRPTTYRISQMSQLAQCLHHPALKGLVPMPTIFDGCQHVLSRDAEAAASALYWSVAQQNQPLISPEATIATLEHGIKLNPWVAEPYFLLAQLYMTIKAYDKAEDAAASGLQLIACWGNSWDKRIGWDAWVSWGRILLQSAQKRTWPEHLHKLNNVALSQP
jgi:hypothetical protein